MYTTLTVCGNGRGNCNRDLNRQTGCGKSKDQENWPVAEASNQLDRLERNRVGGDSVSVSVVLVPCLKRLSDLRDVSFEGSALFGRRRSQALWLCDALEPVPLFAPFCALYQQPTPYLSHANGELDRL